MHKKTKLKKWKTGYFSKQLMAVFQMWPESQNTHTHHKNLVKSYYTGSHGHTNDSYLILPAQIGRHLAYNQADSLATPKTIEQ